MTSPLCFQSDGASGAFPAGFPGSNWFAQHLLEACGGNGGVGSGVNGGVFGSAPSTFLAGSGEAQLPSSLPVTMSPDADTHFAAATSAVPSAPMTHEDEIFLAQLQAMLQEPCGGNAAGISPAGTLGGEQPPTVTAPPAPAGAATFGAQAANQPSHIPSHFRSAQAAADNSRRREHSDGLPLPLPLRAAKSVKTSPQSWPGSPVRAPFNTPRSALDSSPLRRALTAERSNFSDPRLGEAKFGGNLSRLASMPLDGANAAASMETPAAAMAETSPKRSASGDGMGCLSDEPQRSSGSGSASASPAPSTGVSAKNAATPGISGADGSAGRGPSQLPCESACPPSLQSPACPDPAAPHSLPLPCPPPLLPRPRSLPLPSSFALSLLLPPPAAAAAAAAAAAVKLLSVVVEASTDASAVEDMTEEGIARLKDLNITPVMWTAMEELADFLRPFHAVTLAAEGSKYPTINRVVPQFNELLDTLEGIRDNESSPCSRIMKECNFLGASKMDNESSPCSRIMKECINLALGKLNEYYSGSPDELWIATFLDPSFKLGYFQMGKEGSTEGGAQNAQHVAAEQVLELVRAKWRPYKDKAVALREMREGGGSSAGASGRVGIEGGSSSTRDGGGAGSSKGGKGLANDAFGGVVGDQSSLMARLAAFRSRQTVTIKDEIQDYINEQMEPMGVDPLAYWHRKGEDLEGLQAMVLDYLAIPATSAASERTFSLGRNLITWQRHRLGPERVEAVMLLKSWVETHQGCKLGKAAKALLEKAAKDLFGLELDDDA
ncbi:unnamed protein product [Closterium sp. Naga37s-1]|nr:unnamed protein product [Closterium sp. Naga37s-1]